MAKVVSVGCVASWGRELVPVFWLMRLHLVFLVGRSASGCVFWGVCDLIMILCSLSANGFGCVPVLLEIGRASCRERV